MSGLEHYAKIPKRTAHSERLNKLPPATRWVYIILMAEAHGTRERFPITYTEIEKITGFARTTIRRSIVNLARAGFLTYEQGGLQNPNLYTMAKHWLCKDQRAIKDLDAWG